MLKSWQNHELKVVQANKQKMIVKLGYEKQLKQKQSSNGYLSRSRLAWCFPQRCNISKIAIHPAEKYQKF